MTASVASIIRKLLLDSGAIHEASVRGVNKWPSFLATIPNEPDNLVVLSDTASDKDGRLMTGEVIEHHGVQFTVRANTYVAGYAKAKAIEQAMDEVRNNTVALG